MWHRPPPPPHRQPSHHSYRSAHSTAQRAHQALALRVALRVGEQAQQELGRLLGPPALANRVALVLGLGGAAHAACTPQAPGAAQRSAGMASWVAVGKSTAWVRAAPLRAAWDAAAGVVMLARLMLLPLPSGLQVCRLAGKQGWVQAPGMPLIHCHCLPGSGPSLPRSRAAGSTPGSKLS